jgi:hypothetical protein
MFGKRLRALRKSRRWWQERPGFELGVTKATMLPRLDILLTIKRIFASELVNLDLLEDDPADDASRSRLANRHSASGAAPETANQARSVTELRLLARFRALPKGHQQALLKLLAE